MEQRYGINRPLARIKNKQQLSPFFQTFKNVQKRSSVSVPIFFELSHAKRNHIFAWGFKMAGQWRELYNKMVADMQSGAFMRLSSYTIANRTFTYRNLSEFREHLKFVKEQADLEDAKPPYRARIYMGNGGRGWR